MQNDFPGSSCFVNRLLDCIQILLKGRLQLIIRDDSISDDFAKFGFEQPLPYGRVDMDIFFKVASYRQGDSIILNALKQLDKV